MQYFFKELVILLFFINGLFINLTDYIFNVLCSVYDYSMTLKDNREKIRSNNIKMDPRGGAGLMGWMDGRVVVGVITSVLLIEEHCQSVSAG